MTSVNPKILYDLLEKDFLPIVCPIGFDEDFQTYNINADDAACAIATAVKAEKLAFSDGCGGGLPGFRGQKFPDFRDDGGRSPGFVLDSGALGGGMPPSCRTASTPSTKAFPGPYPGRDGFPTACCWKSSPTKESVRRLSNRRRSGIIME